METNEYREHLGISKAIGICLTVIGVILIIIGSINLYNYIDVLGGFWVLSLVAIVPGGILFITGVGLWVHSALKRKRMGKPHRDWRNKIRKIE